LQVGVRLEGGLARGREALGEGIGKSTGNKGLAGASEAWEGLTDKKGSFTGKRERALRACKREEKALQVEVRLGRAYKYSI
jgi:hypothetical protein